MIVLRALRKPIPRVVGDVPPEKNGVIGSLSYSPHGR